MSKEKKGNIPMYDNVDEVVISKSDFYLADYNRSVATLPTNLAASQALMEFSPFPNDPKFLSAELSAVINTYQPLVSSTCHNFNSSQDGWTYYVMRNGSVDRLKTISELNMPILRHSEYNYTAPIWLTAPDNLASLVVVLPQNKTLQDGSKYYHGSTCTLSSYWWRTDAFLKVMPDPYRLRLSVKQPDLTDTGTIKTTSSLRPITVNPSDIESLNSANFTFDIHNSPIMLAAVWVATLALVPSQQYDEIAKSGRKLNISDAEENASNAKYTVTTLSHGFGYGPTDTASKLSAAVIATYCLISLLFVAYIIITGHTSIAWDSAMELIVLALQSKEPDSLGHVSVGLNSMDTFRKTVGIRVNRVPVGDTGETREILELIFEHDEDTEKRGLTKVVRNRAY